MRTIWILVLGLSFAGVAAAPVSGTFVTAGSEISSGYFGEDEREIIEDYFGRGVKTGKKGKKGKSVPPGLARQLERKGTLPPGLAKKALPPGLTDRLPPTRAGQERVIVGDDVVLVETVTGVILDIIRDVIRDRGK